MKLTRKIVLLAVTIPAIGLLAYGATHPYGGPHCIPGLNCPTK